MAFVQKFMLLVFHLPFRVYFKIKKPTLTFTEQNAIYVLKMIKIYELGIWEFHINGNERTYQITTHW